MQAPPRQAPRTAVLRFTGHFLEMAGAMLVGMVALSRLESWLASALGSPHAVATTVSASVMAATMIAVTAAWMSLRGHGLRLVAEMAAGMTVGFLVTAPQWIGGTGHASMFAGHEPMFLGMFVAMLARREHYSGSEPEHQ